MGVLLNIPTVKPTTFVARSFSYVAPRLWNSLPTNIRCTNNLDKFKVLLKTNLVLKGILLIAPQPESLGAIMCCKVHVTITLMGGSCIALYQMLHYYCYYFLSGSSSHTIVDDDVEAAPIYRRDGKAGQPIMRPCENHDLCMKWQPTLMEN